MPDLLLELLSEEIPARMQERASGDLKRLVTDGLVARGLHYAHAEAYATPRRLALAISGLAAKSASITEERKGPRTNAPESALEGFLRSTGLARDQLEQRQVKGVEVWFAVTAKPGQPASEIVAEVVKEVVQDFPWPKSMRWGNGDLRWVRPLQSILCILSDEAGTEVVPLWIDGIEAGDTTEGHRFMSPERFTVSGFEHYESRLRAAHVLLDPEERRQRIWHDAMQVAFARNQELVEDSGLLSEIAGLVEWPVVLLGTIEPRFLDLPPEVLRTSMKAHQKFLSVREPVSDRITSYVVVANRETADGGATVLAGNARVLAARLSDAAFFWKNDLQTPLGEMAQRLEAVTFHRRLGSQGDRITRIAVLARRIAPMIGADPDLADRAARIAKVDLASEMVYEFPELQGVMGRYYALASGEDASVANAASEHYSPLGPSDTTPSAPISVTVALADKIDLLTGFWAIDEKPTGSKDPFALRRAALGVIRLIVENGLRIDLPTILREGYQGADCDDLFGFIGDRLKVHLREEGIRHDILEAVAAPGDSEDLVSLVARARALQELLGTTDGENLVQGYRRAINILRAEEKKDGVEYSLDPHPDLAQTPDEKALFAALDGTETALEIALGAEDFPKASQALARLRAPIDAFFETTVVNVDSDTLRRNRLCLLNRIRVVMNRVADFSAVESG